MPGFITPFAQIQVMADNDITRVSMGDPAQFLRLQKLILEPQQQAEDESAGRSVCILSDHSGVDPLAYTAWRFGLDSPEVCTDI